MKTLTSKMIAVVILASISVFASCTDFSDFLSNQFNETSHLSTNITVDGEIAAPILNTSFSLSNFIPISKDSSIWAEVGEQNIIHIRMYIKNFYTLAAKDIYGCPILAVVPADSLIFSSDTNKIKLYDNALSGHVFFYDPRIKIILFSKIPVVSFFTIDTIRFHSPAYDSTYVATFGKQYINKPASPSETAKSEILITKANLPNLVNIFSPIPKFISFRITLGSDAVQNINIAEYPDICDRQIWGDVDIDLPLDTRVQDLILSDTTAFPVFTNVDQIDSVKLKLFLDNEIPLGGKLNLIITDTIANGVADSIALYQPFNNWTLLPGITDENGFAIKSTHSEFVLVIKHDDLEMLLTKHASKIILSATLDSYNTDLNQNVKILSTNKLHVKMGVKISYKASSSNL